MVMSSLSQSEYSVSTPLFSGPMDLLLQLIEKAELDITRLALAQVTDQYLQHIQDLPADIDADEVSSFLVMAARLLQIKSEMLLPRPPAPQPESLDSGEMLARQLIIYRRFKDIALLLENNESANLHTYLRLASYPKIDGAVDLEGLTLDDLLAAALQVFSPHEHQPLGTVISPYRVTIREKIGLIARFLNLGQGGTFRQLLVEKPHRLDVVVTFLAILELIKRQLILTAQNGLFEEISFQPAEAWEKVDEQFELEFGE
jgi:segregation and condensation protein A